MDEELRNILSRFDDPPWTVRGVCGGLGLLALLILAIGHWSAISVALGAILERPLLSIAAGLAAFAAIATFRRIFR